jgi:type II secretory pathway pseudopilin PulG
VTRSASKNVMTPARVGAVIALLGLGLTAAVAFTVRRIDTSNERRLLQVETTQAAEVLTLAITTVQGPLQTALGIASATNGDPRKFDRFMSAYTGAQGAFDSAELWQIDGSSPVFLASTGETTGPTPSAPAPAAFLMSAVHKSPFAVTSTTSGGLPGIAYAIADPKSPSYVVYAERANPANRRAAVASNTAFADLHYAIYLGATTASSALTTTDVDPAKLPLRGNTDQATVPFGDTSLTLATSPARHLGGSFESQLPWLLFGAGLLFTFGASTLVGQLVRRRMVTDDAANTIGDLYGQLEAHYGEQRTIAETLQHALLPQSNPAIRNLEIASRYVAGARGVDVGGDWYSIIGVDEAHFAFVVGDVSGRGVEAAVVMALIRFTVRAYLVEGHSPTAALELCSRQLDVATDGHFATLLVGLGDLTSGEITLANAGHLNPLVASASDVQFVETTPGVPLGVGDCAYPATTIVLEPHSTFIAFTDGLVERRGEDIDVGLARLANTVRATSLPLDDLLTNTLAVLTDGGTEDDIAILAFTWAPASEA